MSGKSMDLEFWIKFELGNVGFRGRRQTAENLPKKTLETRMRRKIKLYLHITSDQLWEYNPGNYSQHWGIPATLL